MIRTGLYQLELRRLSGIIFVPPRIPPQRSPRRRLWRLYGTRWTSTFLRAFPSQIGGSLPSFGSTEGPSVDTRGPNVSASFHLRIAARGDLRFNRPPTSRRNSGPTGNSSLMCPRCASSVLLGMITCRPIPRSLVQASMRLGEPA